MLRVWTVSDFTFIFLMWTTMMIGMMTPSGHHDPDLCARRRQAAQESRRLPRQAGCQRISSSWTAFSIVASIAQGALERVAWLTPMMAAASK